MDHEPSSVVIAGMGGSGIVAEVVSDVASEKDSSVQIRALKDYHLPRDVDRASVVIGVSCSGNTEETLGVLHEAAQRGVKGYTFGSGGLIEAFSKKNSGYKFTRTPMLKVPRSSLPGILFPVLRLLSASKIINLGEEEVAEAFGAMEAVKANAGDLHNPEFNPSLSIGTALNRADPCPLVYSSRRTRSVGLRFRQSLNENAKMHAFDGTVPELCHNEIVGWDLAASRAIGRGTTAAAPTSVLLKLDDDPEELRIRFEILRDIISKSDGRTIDAPFQGASYFAKIMSMLYSLDYATYFTSILRQVDPILTPSIDLLKKELQSRLDYLKRFGG